MSSENTPKTVYLRGNSIQREGKAASIIKVGALVMPSGGETYDLNTGVGAQGPFVAVENRDLGMVLGDQYEIGASVKIVPVANGDRCMLLLATGKAVTAGDKVIAVANGKVEALVTVGVVVGYAVDTVSNSSGEDMYIRVDMINGQVDEGSSYVYAVDPATKTVDKGKTQQFTLTRNGVAVPQPLDWEITGANKAGTTITAGGLLTIAADETAAAVTVKVRGGTETATVTVGS